MEQVAPEVFSWNQYSERLKYDLNGFYWCAGEEAVVVDPPELTEAAREHMKDHGEPTLIVVTNRTHWRATTDLRDQTGARVAMSQLDAAAVERVVERILAPGEELPGGWRVLDMAGKTLGEMGLHREADDGALLLGDSLIGDPPGQLRLLPAEKIDDRDLLLASLARLTPLRYQILLLGDGEPIRRDADRRVREFLHELTA
jgi:hypothetical protein